MMRMIFINKSFINDHKVIKKNFFSHEIKYMDVLVYEYWGIFQRANLKRGYVSKKKIN